MDAVSEEVVADAFGTILNDSGLLQQFAREHTTVLQRIADSIRDTIRRVNRAVSMEDLQLTDSEKRRFSDLASELAGMEKNMRNALRTVESQSARAYNEGNKQTDIAKLKRKGMTEEEAAALLSYKSSESYKVNAKMRDGVPLTDSEQKMISELDKALKKLPKVEGTVYRTLNFDDVSNPVEDFNAFMALHSEGGVVGYAAYTSASTEQNGYPLADGTKYGVTIEIDSKNARDLAGFGNNFESEALFSRETAFDVVKVSVDETGQTHIYMKELEDNAQRNESDHDTQKRGMAMRDLQEAYSAHADLQSVPGSDPKGNPVRIRNLQGTGEKGTLKDSSGRTLTEAQAEYFKDSKVRDKDGNLQVVYHGTGADFTVFDKSKVGQNYSNRGGDLGFYFSPYIEDAQGYARENGGKRVEAVYLNLTNPLVVEDTGWGSAIGQADVRHNDLARWAKDGNHDGIIVKSLDEDMGNGEVDTVYIAFEPEQIKQVSNQNPTNGPDIRYSRSNKAALEEFIQKYGEAPEATEKAAMALLKENEQLREVNEGLKAQFKRTELKKVDKRKLNSLTKQLLKDYSSGVDIDDARTALDGLYTYLANGENGDSAVWEETKKSHSGQRLISKAQSTF